MITKFTDLKLIELSALIQIENTLLKKLKIPHLYYLNYFYEKDFHKKTRNISISSFVY